MVVVAAHCVFPIGVDLLLRATGASHGPGNAAYDGESVSVFFRQLDLHIRKSDIAVTHHAVSFNRPVLSHRWRYATSSATSSRFRWCLLPIQRNDEPGLLKESL